jgi:hypothetical protein
LARRKRRRTLCKNRKGSGTPNFNCKDQSQTANLRPGQRVGHPPKTHPLHKPQRVRHPELQLLQPKTNTTSSPGRRVGHPPRRSRGRFRGVGRPTVRSRIPKSRDRDREPWGTPAGGVVGLGSLVSWSLRSERLPTTNSRRKPGAPDEPWGTRHPAGGVVGLGSLVELELAITPFAKNKFRKESPGAPGRGPETGPWEPTTSSNQADNARQHHLISPRHRSSNRGGSTSPTRNCPPT